MQAEREARKLGYDGDAAVLHVCWDKEFLIALLLICFIRGRGKDITHLVPYPTVT
jgi:hypothetical protein